MILAGAVEYNAFGAGTVTAMFKTAPLESVTTTVAAPPDRPVMTRPVVPSGTLAVATDSSLLRAEYGGVPPLMEYKLVTLFAAMVTAEGDVLVNGIVETVTVTVIEAPLASVMRTGAEPPARAPSVSLLPDAVALTTVALLLLATYGGMPPVMRYSLLAPGTSVSAAGAVVNNEAGAGTVTEIVRFAPLASATCTVAAPVATALIARN